MIQVRKGGQKYERKNLFLSYWAMTDHVKFMYSDSVHGKATRLQAA